MGLVGWGSFGRVQLVRELGPPQELRGAPGPLTAWPGLSPSDSISDVHPLHCIQSPSLSFPHFERSDVPLTPTMLCPHLCASGTLLISQRPRLQPGVYKSPASAEVGHPLLFPPSGLAGSYCLPPRGLSGLPALPPCGSCPGKLFALMFCPGYFISPVPPLVNACPLWH